MLKSVWPEFIFSPKRYRENFPLFSLQVLSDVHSSPGVLGKMPYEIPSKELYIHFLKSVH